MEKVRLLFLVILSGFAATAQQYVGLGYTIPKQKMLLQKISGNAVFGNNIDTSLTIVRKEKRIENDFQPYIFYSKLDSKNREHYFILGIRNYTNENRYNNYSTTLSFLSIKEIKESVFFGYNRVKNFSINKCLSLQLGLKSIFSYTYNYHTEDVREYFNLINWSVFPYNKTTNNVDIFNIYSMQTGLNFMPTVCISKKMQLQMEVLFYNNVVWEKGKLLDIIVYENTNSVGAHTYGGASHESEFIVDVNYSANISLKYRLK